MTETSANWTNTRY